MDADTSDIIDDEWINEYKHEEEKYDIFYKKEVTSIKLFFIYISSHHEIEKIIKDNYNIINKSITKKELTEIIKQHASARTSATSTSATSTSTSKAATSTSKAATSTSKAATSTRTSALANKEYILNSIFKYNITLKPDEIEDFINNENEYENDYMSNISLQEEDEEFEDILFENTIDFFKDLNAIYIFFTLPEPAEALPAEALPAQALPAEALEIVRKKLKKTKKNTHNSIKNNKTSKNQKNLKII